MTSSFAILLAATVSGQTGAVQLFNPLPPVKGGISGRGPTQRKSGGFEPVEPASIPGVYTAFIGGGTEPTAPLGSIQQGPNAAFEGMIAKLFGEAPAATAPSRTEGRKLAAAATTPVLRSEVPLAPPKPRPQPSAERANSSSEPLPRPSAKPVQSLTGPIGAAARRQGARPAPRPNPILPPALTTPTWQGVTSSQGEPPQQPKPQPKSDPVPVTVQPGPQAADPGDKIVNVNVADLELSKILQILSEQTGANLILLSPNPKTLTLRLTKTPLRETIGHIAAISGLRTLRIGSAFVIAAAADLEAAYPVEYALAYPKAPEPPAPTPPSPPVFESEVLTLSYALAGEIVNVLKEAFTEKELRAQIGPAQHIPSLASAETEAVTGVQTGILREEQRSSGGSEADKNSNPNSRILVLHGTKEAIAGAKKLAAQLDKPRPQVGISVKIIDISNDSMKDLGLTWTFGDTAIRESDGDGFNLRRFSRDPQTFFAKISALEKADKAKIMAEPNISVLDNQRAFILIGQRLNFPTLIGYTQANTPIFAPKEERVGIYMQVAASIAPNGEITMSLYPQVSTVTSFLEVNGASYPQISTREAQTTLRVKSGESIVLGGLIRDEEIKNVQKVPFLSDIPILGEFFRKVKTQKTSSQIIIAITPVVTFPSSHAP
jgi:type II secretory pathway component GspD/PulD (secretin)